MTELTHNAVTIIIAELKYCISYFKICLKILLFQKVNWVKCLISFC